MGVTYLFENWQAANVRLDKMQLPAVMYVLPASGNLNVGLMQMKDYPNCMIALWIRQSMISPVKKMTW